VTRLFSGCVAILAGLGLIAVSFVRAFPVYDEDLPADETAFYEEIGEFQLVEDSTFSGVRLSKLTGRLITTYDRTQPKGRPACPT